MGGAMRCAPSDLHRPYFPSMVVLFLTTHCASSLSPAQVINVGGNRIGTEEIESALLQDREAEGSPLLNCAVVGMDDPMLGTVPCAFVVLQPGAALMPVDEGRLRALVQAKHSSVAVPARFVTVEALPETHSGKYMRRLLRAMLSGAPLGD